MTQATTTERDLLRQTVRVFLERESSESEVRRLMETSDGFDSDLWSTMATQLGLQGLGIPEIYGGSGFGWKELGVVFEECGRALLCSPFLATVALASTALLLSDDEQARQRYLPAIAGGDLIATVALPVIDMDAVTALPTKESADTFDLTGRMSQVLDGCLADLILVPADGPGGPGVFLVEPADTDPSGLRRSALPTLDETRKEADLIFTGCQARELRLKGTSADLLGEILDVAVVALACEQTGGAGRCLEFAVDYARTRMQFGRPVGSFQAIRHRCVDMLLDVESARSLAAHAVELVTSGQPLRTTAHMTKAYCSEAFMRVAATSIQVHGGIGITWEHSGHLFLKRAKSSQLRFGTPAQHRASLARVLRSEIAQSTQ